MKPKVGLSRPGVPVRVANTLTLVQSLSGDESMTDIARVTRPRSQLA